MFSGIVEELSSVIVFERREKSARLALLLSHTKGLKIGASISVNGCCLTVADINHQTVYFDLVEETLLRTTLGNLQKGERVNVERSLLFGDEIGGHLLSGHIYCQGEVASLSIDHENALLTIHSTDATPYIHQKGYIAIDGVSLTVGEVRGAFFDLHLIPETRRQTNLAQKKPGSKVNIEIDPIYLFIHEKIKESMKSFQKESFSPPK